MNFYPLYATADGDIYEDTSAELLGRSGAQWLLPERQEMIPLPTGASLVSIPGFVPVGRKASGAVQALSGTDANLSAVGALLPQGFTRTLLPACVGRRPEPMPLYGYAAVGFWQGRFYVAAVQSAAYHKWHPRYYHTERLPERIAGIVNQLPDNPIVRQLACCSLDYGCFTAQNFFYRRWEAGIPTYPSCNADCIGCISESHIAGVTPPQERLAALPTAEDIAEVGLFHLSRARDGIISFGQGCEGEPTLNASRLAPAIRQIRQLTDRGTINVNTNAGYTAGIRLMTDAGLDAMRVTIFSARPENYVYYHRPAYAFTAVSDSIDYAKAHGVKVALNLLVFPGITDLEPEAEALIDLVRRHRVDMIQLRNLNLDPDLLWSGLPAGKEAPVLGITGLLARLQAELPELELGSYSTPYARR